MKEEIVFDDSKSIYENLLENDIYIDAPCGGNGFCNKCLVKINGEEKLACKSYINGKNEIEFNEEKIDELDKNIDTLLIDLGTTNIKIIGLLSGRKIQEIVIENPQKYFGADVISRLTFATSKEQHLIKLQDVILKKIDSFNLLNLQEVILAGNTIMQKIITKSSFKDISKPPYLIDDFGLKKFIRKNVEFIAFPNIEGYIGGDSVALLLNFVDRLEEMDNTLILDIGTNSEIFLISDGKIQCCSAAAGPAFEGGIECGSNFQSGALLEVSNLEDGVSYTAYDSNLATSIAGSGLISLVNELLEVELITKDGVLKEKSEIFPHLNRYIQEDKFYINDNIYISQNDIREIQLAKSAIRTGIDILLEKLEKKEKDILKIIISGSFGENIAKKNLMKIGIIPRIGLERIKLEDNLVLKGLIRYYADKKILYQFEKIRDSIFYENLSENILFKEKFIKNLSFSKIFLDK